MSSPPMMASLELMLVAERAHWEHHGRPSWSQRMGSAACRSDVTVDARSRDGPTVDADSSAVVFSRAFGPERDSGGYKAVRPILAEVDYAELADLPVRIDGIGVSHREQDTSSGFTRATSVVSLHGGDKTGRGEDVTYETAEHATFQATGSDLPLSGEWTLGSFGDRLSELDLFFGSEPEQAVSRNYRRWALESAALDLGLKQAGQSLADRLGASYDPVRFVVSTRLDDPPTADRVMAWLDRDPSLAFKLDPTPDWTPAVISRLAETDRVRILDLKGFYHGTSVDQAPDPDFYKRVLTGFPEAIIEDPALTPDTRPLVADHRERVAWDYPIRGLADVDDLPWSPTWLNIKPSRFDSLEALCETISYALENDIRMYGGGQFELDVGREQLHALASLCYPETPNDVAPAAYNVSDPPAILPGSPLEPPAHPSGFEWSMQ